MGWCLESGLWEAGRLRWGHEAGSWDGSALTGQTPELDPSLASRGHSKKTVVCSLDQSPLGTHHVGPQDCGKWTSVV